MARSFAKIKLRSAALFETPFLRDVQMSDMVLLLIRYDTLDEADISNFFEIYFVVWLSDGEQSLSSIYEHLSELKSACNTCIQMASMTDCIPSNTGYCARPGIGDRQLLDAL